MFVGQTYFLLLFLIFFDNMEAPVGEKNKKRSKKQVKKIVQFTCNNERKQMREKGNF